MPDGRAADQGPGACISSEIVVVTGLNSRKQFSAWRQLTIFQKASMWWEPGLTVLNSCSGRGDL